MKYIRVVEQEIAITQSHIDRHKGVGNYIDNCAVWEHHITAYKRVLELLTEAKTKGKKS